MNPIAVCSATGSFATLFFVGIPVGALLGILAKRMEKKYKGKSDALRGILLGLPFALLTLAVILVDIIF